LTSSGTFTVLTRNRDGTGYGEFDVAEPGSGQSENAGNFADNAAR
jgi:hypothetical protein